MSRASKTIAWIIVAAVIIGGIWYASKKQLAENKPVKIGAILMLTGDYAAWGQEMQKGIDIAAEQINRGGGINGRIIKVIYEDSGLVNYSQITSVAQKLINVDRVNAAIIDTSDAIKPIAPIFQQAKVPIIVVYDDTKTIRESGDYIVSIGFSTDKNGEKMAEFAYNKLNLKKVAIVAQKYDWSEIIAPAFKDKFEALGGKIAAFESVPIEENDFRTIIAKIKRSGADGVYLAVVINLDLFLKQAKEQKLNAPLLTGDVFTDDVIAAAGDAAENVYFTNFYTNDNPLLQKLQQDYKIKYGQEPPLLTYTSLAYDGLKVLSEAIKQTKIVSPETIKDALYLIKDLDSSSGARITISPQKNLGRIEKLYQFKEGQKIPLE